MRISDWSSDVCSSDLSIEARLAGDIGPANWVVGVYGVNDTVDFLTDLDETDSAASIVRTNYRQTRKSRAVFGQVDWPITDKFTVTGGLRYTDDKARFAGSDRKSVVSGKSVSVRVDRGGGRIIKKK